MKTAAGRGLGRYFHTTPIPGTSSRAFRRESVGCRFQIRNTILGYRSHFFREPKITNQGVCSILPGLPSLPSSTEEIEITPRMRRRFSPSGIGPALSGQIHTGAKRSRRTAVRIVSWLTPKSAARERRRLNDASDRTAASWSTIGFRCLGLHAAARRERPAGRRSGAAAKGT